MPMIVAVVNQGNTIDDTISARNVNQGFLIPVTQVAVVLRSVVDRTLAGQRESVFGRQEIRIAELEGHTLLNVDGLMLFESKFFGTLETDLK